MSDVARNSERIRFNWDALVTMLAFLAFGFGPILMVISFFSPRWATIGLVSVIGGFSALLFIGAVSELVYLRRHRPRPMPRKFKRIISPPPA